MNQDRIQHELNRAIRQFRHNDGSPDFVHAYDHEIIDHLVTDLQARIERLEMLLDEARSKNEELRRYTPEQAHEDALATLDAAWEGLSGLNANTQKWQQIGTLYRIARQALTAESNEKTQDRHHEP